MYDAAFSTESGFSVLSANTPAVVTERWKALATDHLEALPVFQKKHGLLGAWRVDPHSLTPWVIAHAPRLPKDAQVAAMEAQLGDASASASFLLWLLCDDGAEQLIIHLGRPDERWVVRNSSGRPLPHLRELTDAFSADLPYPMRLAHAAALLTRKDVTHRFYRQIQQSVKNIANAWQADMPIADDDRHELALILVARLMFLHFVQSKHWLPHPEYLAEIAHHNAPSNYQKYWRPLFFDALNLPPDERTSGVIPREIPYLNGGLFAPSALEEAYPTLDLPNDVLRTLIIDVFQRYAFVDDEHEGHPHAIAPQLLGEIFERLMCPEERQVTGAFYTPHPLALELWQQTLAEFLRDTQGKELTEKLLKRAPLTHEQAQQLFDCLWNLRVLDPAVGTGAFLLAALIDLEAHARHLLTFLPGKNLSRRAMRERWVTHTLHGIDIQRNAVLLAELRLWLSVTAVSENTPAAATPLPNLEHRLRTGNALIAPTWQRIASQSAVLQSLMRDLSSALQDFPTQRGAARHQALQKLHALEHAILRQGAQDRIEELKHARSAQLSLDATPTNLPNAEERALQELLTSTGAWQQTGLLDPKLHYADVMQEGGFDIILGNPPWGQLSTLDDATQKTLRRRYHVFQSKGGRQSSPDMSIGFFEAYLPLLSDQGRMAFLFPSKTLRARWGASWRSWAQHQVVFDTLQELSTHSNHGFHASVYPCVSILRKRRRGENPQVHPTLVASRPQNTVLSKELRPLAAHFTPRYGVKTGCNRAFLLSKNATSPLALPALRGKNIRRFSYHCDQQIVFTHHTQTGEVLNTLPSAVEARLRNFDAQLHKRSDLRPNMPAWTLFRVRRESVGWRVAWRDVAQRLEAVVLPPLDAGGPVNLNSTYGVAVQNQDDARVLCAWLNADAVSAYLQPSAQRARNGYYRFDASLVSSVPLPNALFEPQSALRKQALALFSCEGAPDPDLLMRWNRAVTRIIQPS